MKCSENHMFTWCKLSFLIRQFEFKVLFNSIYLYLPLAFVKQDIIFVICFPRDEFHTSLAVESLDCVQDSELDLNYKDV